MKDSKYNKRNPHNHKEHHDEFSSVKHTVKRKQTERKLRKKRKKANYLKTFLSSTLLICLVLLIYEFFKLPQWYLPQDTFTNASANRVEILNNKIIPTYVINNNLKNIEIQFQSQTVLKKPTSQE